MTDLDFAELRRLTRGATPGPWDRDWDGYGELSQDWTMPQPWQIVIEMRGRDSWSGCDHALYCSPADAQLIVAMRNALPDLLDEVERLRAEVAAERTDCELLDEALVDALTRVGTATAEVERLRTVADAARCGDDVALMDALNALDEIAGDGG